MFRRDFLKGSAITVAALCSPLAASAFNTEASLKKMSLVSKKANETGYIEALKTLDGFSGGNIITLGLDGLENFGVFSTLIDKNRGALIYGLLDNSDFALLSHAANAKGAKFVSETFHTPTNDGTRHSESSFANITTKEAFEQFTALSTNQYGFALSSFHIVPEHKAGSIEKQSEFISVHSSKNSFVSFMLKA